MNIDNMQFPHCDPRVLHAPGQCKYCDQNSEWQQLREAWNISFTGRPEVGKTLCPSDQARGVGGAHVWGGNRPQPPKFERCLRPPEGWKCTRERGHEGPCAALPMEAPLDESPCCYAPIYQGHSGPYCGRCKENV